MCGVARTGLNPGQTLMDCVTSIGLRWARSIDPTSTLDPYNAGLHRRILPTLGQLPVSMLTAGLIDRAMDRWEAEFGASTVKNTVAVLVLVLDQAVRNGRIPRNPSKDRARRKKIGHRGGNAAELHNPRDLALPGVVTLDGLVTAVGEAGGHRYWADVMTVLTTTAMRIIEVAGLRVGDVSLFVGVIRVELQTYPGRGGLITKTIKNRRHRTVPIIDQLRPALERLMLERKPEASLITGPRGNVITTATLRGATSWDLIVADRGLPTLVRHGLRQTALTWMADAETDLCVLQRVAGHQDPAVTARYLHPDHAAPQAARSRLSAWLGLNGDLGQRWRDRRWLR